VRPACSYSSHYTLYLTTSTLTFAFFIFFFNDTATTEISTLSLHDALPISAAAAAAPCPWRRRRCSPPCGTPAAPGRRARSTPTRSEEHTSELQSPCNLVCRLLLEKKKNKSHIPTRPRHAQASPHNMSMRHT